MFRKNIFSTIFSAVFAVFVASSAKAVCPACTLVVGAGVGLSRWLGIDDVISGIWIGGFMVSIIGWTLDWFKKKNLNFKFKNTLISILLYILVLVPLYYKGIIGHPLNKFCGIDKLLLGIIIGSIVFLAAVLLHLFLKKKNQGKSYFPYQKVVLPVSSLIIISLLFYFVVC